MDKRILNRSKIPDNAAHALHRPHYPLHPVKEDSFAAAQYDPQLSQLTPPAKNCHPLLATIYSATHQKLHREK